MTGAVTGPRRCVVRTIGPSDGLAAAELVAGLLRRRRRPLPSSIGDMALGISAALTGAPEGVPQVEGLIAELDKAPVGLLLFHTAFDAAVCRPGLFVEDLHVVADARGQGVGAALFRRVASIAMERQHAYVMFVVEADDHNAVEQYRRLGAEAILGRQVMRLGNRPLASLAALDTSKAE